MKRPLAIAWILASCVLVRCNLNPQPFPPNAENPTGGGAGARDSSVPIGPGADGGSALGNTSADAAVDVSAHAPEAAPADAAFPFEDAGEDAPADASLPFEDAGDAGEDASADATAADAPSEADAPELNDAPSESEGADGEATADGEAGPDSEAGAD